MFLPSFSCPIYNEGYSYSVDEVAKDGDTIEKRLDSQHIIAYISTKS